ncbi:hypothetical protein [Flindersiella endophytica]
MGADLDVLVQHARSAVFSTDDDGLAGAGSADAYALMPTLVMPSAAITAMTRTRPGGGGGGKRPVGAVAVEPNVLTSSMLPALIASLTER